MPYAFWSEALLEGKKHNLEYGQYGPYDNVGIELDYEKKFGQSRPATNAFGATVSVTDVETLTYLVFDRRGTAKWIGEIDWAGDSGDNPSGIGKRIKVEVPVSQARHMKETLNIGVTIRPKGIKKIQSTLNSDATLTGPFNINATYNVIVADILCAVIVDDESKVLQTVELQHR